MFVLDNISHNRIITLTMGQIAKVKVTVYTLHFFCLTITFLRVTWMGMILHTIVVHDPGVVVAGGICPVRTCLALLELGPIS